MIIPLNFKNFTDEVLKVEIFSDFEVYDSEEMLLYWNVTEFENEFMKIQLHLQDPILVSS